MLTRLRTGLRLSASLRQYSVLPQRELFGKKEEINAGLERIQSNIQDLEKYPDLFDVHNLFTVEDLFNARVHLGHKIGSLDDRMKEYVYGSRLGHLVIDLDQSAVHLRKALNFTAHTAYRGGLILFLNRNALNAHTVEKAAMDCGEFSHTRYWRGGVFTNANVQFKTTIRLPDLCIFFNTLNNILAQHTAIRDAAKMSIPTIGIVDTNCNPNLLTYAVPGNDDTPAAIQLYTRLFKEAILRGKAKRVVDLETLKGEQEALGLVEEDVKKMTTKEE